MDDEPLVERTIELDAAVEEVWAALTEPERLSAWVGGEVTELDARPGGRGSVRRSDGATRRLVVEAVDAERRLALRWWPFEEDSAPPPAGSGTRVEFLLEPLADGTVLRVIEHCPPVLDHLEAADQAPSDAIGFERSFGTWSSGIRAAVR